MKKPYWKMTLTELREATKRFDKEIPFEKTKPLTPTERREFKKFQRGPSVSLYCSRSGKLLAKAEDGKFTMLTKRPPKWLLSVEKEYRLRTPRN